MKTVSLFVLFLLSDIFVYSVQSESTFFKNESRIVGGKPITIDRFPWQLSLRFKDEHRCSASLITVNRALSVAHCLRAGDDLTDLTIMAGSTTRHPDGTSSIVGLQKFLRHPKFDNLTLDNDIAVLWLSYKLTLGTKINLIKLPKSNANSNDITTVLISGWGFTREADSNSIAYQLQYTAISLIPRKICKTVYGNHLKDSMFCAGVMNGGKDACQGDSGGAMSAQGIQIGIISWGVYCGHRDYPGVFTNVSQFRQWIDSVL